MARLMFLPGANVVDEVPCMMLLSKT